MNEETRERELSMDEIESASGGQTIVPLTQHAVRIVEARQGVVDDSV
jgi:hypothetical protein